MCIVFTFHFASKTHIRAYNNVSSAVLYWYLGLEYLLPKMLLSRPPYCLLRWALTWDSRTVVAAYVLEFCPQCLHVAYIVLPLIWDLKVLKGVLFSLFTSSIRLISGSTILSPQQYWYLALSIAPSAMLFSWPLYSSKVSSYLVLKNCLHSSCPRGVCCILIPALYLYGEGCIVFTFQFVSKVHNRGYIIMPPQQCSNLGIRIYSLDSSNLCL